MEKKFKQPVIVGALCRHEKDVPKELERRLKRHGKKVAFLKFVTEPRFLKNLPSCMKILDISVMFVPEDMGQFCQSKSQPFDITL